MVLMCFLVWSCSSAPPFLLQGTEADIAQLAGVWEGMYISTATQRGGIITFSLEAEADTAHGLVTMIPRGWGKRLAPADAQARENRPDLLHSLKR